MLNQEQLPRRPDWLFYSWICFLCLLFASCFALKVLSSPVLWSALLSLFVQPNCLSWLFMWFTCVLNRVFLAGLSLHSCILLLLIDWFVLCFWIFACHYSVYDLLLPVRLKILHTGLCSSDWLLLCIWAHTLTSLHPRETSPPLPSEKVPPENHLCWRFVQSERNKL